MYVYWTILDKYIRTYQSAAKLYIVHKTVSLPELANILARVVESHHYLSSFEIETPWLPNPSFGKPLYHFSRYV
jgi:hypothetical protein